MSQSKSTVTGLAAALVLGGGGGVLLGPLSAIGASDVTSTASPHGELDRVSVEEVKGEVEVLVAGGSWRTARSGDRVERPTAFRAHGPDSFVVVSREGIRFALQHDGILLVGGAEKLVLELSSGRLLLHSRSGPVRVSVPTSQSHVSGEAFGIWARPEALVAAVLDGSLSIENASGVATQYAKGREITVNARGDTPVVLEPRLGMELVSVARRGRRFLLTGRTLASALVVSRVEDKLERVAVASDGTFSVESDTKDPGPGALVAYDAAGRRAEVSKPSASLDQVLASLSKGAPIAGVAKVEVVEPPAHADEPKEETAPPKEAPREERENARERRPERPAKVERTETVERAGPRREEAHRPEAVERTEQTEQTEKVAERPARGGRGDKDEKTEKGGEQGAGRGHQPSAIPVDLFPKAAEEQPSQAQPPPRPKKKEDKKKDEGGGVELQWGE